MDVVDVSIPHKHIELIGTGHVIKGQGAHIRKRIAEFNPRLFVLS